MASLPLRIDHAPGDATGLMLPAHGEALLAGGAEWLTAAFRAFGAMGVDNAVTAITGWEACPGGSTGAKAFMNLAYTRLQADLPGRLFVKFSRDFDDARRDDPGRFEMAGEARFMPLTRSAAFPVEVPRALFADYHLASGTGLVITERIAFGEGGIEPHRVKCMDHETLADPLPHYRAIVTALARLCGAHRAGRLGPDIDAVFPFDPATGSADPVRIDAAGLEAQIASCQSFAREAPHMLPADLADGAFLAEVARGARLALAHEARLRAELLRDPAMIALCHWNAHIDNAWFRRDEGGALRCGLIDWGRVGQNTFGAALWGALSAAHPAVWRDHLPELLGLFAREYAAAGGPPVAPEALHRHLALHMALMGVARMLAFPEIIRFRCPDVARLSGPRDPALLAIPPARNCLHIYTNFLRHWQACDFTALVAEVTERPPGTRVSAIR